MNSIGALDEMIERKLMDVHTIFLATIVSTNGRTATIQPLNMFKQYGQKAQKQAVIPNVPISHEARYKTEPKEITYISSVTLNTTSGGGYLTSASITPAKTTVTVSVPKEIAKGDTVVCGCSERDITETKKGNIALPQIGRHQMTDCIIIGILQQ